MAKIQVSKQEAALRQTNAAILMLFHGVDALACATVAGAASRLVRDLAQVGGKSRSLEALKAVVRPEMEKEFWRVFHSVPNFLKHAEKDPEGILEFEDEWIELSLFFTVMIYRDLGNQLTPEMNALAALVVAEYPNFLTVPNGIQAELLLQQANAAISTLNRSERLHLGLEFCKLLKRA